MAAAEEPTIGQRGQVVTVGPDETVADAARLMRDSNVGSLVVVSESGAVMGIFTERDIVNRSTATCGDASRMRVAEIMTAAPVSCGEATPVSKIQQVMVAYGIRHLPVVRDGKAVGMVSSRDVLAYQLEVNKAMKAAAEQVALMGKGLKSLDLEEVLGAVVTEVPKIFQARRCVLHFSEEGADGSRQPLIRGKDCPCCEKGLVVPDQLAEQSTSSEVRSGEVPPVCRDLGCGGVRVVVPLAEAGPTVEGDGPQSQRQSFLCMCGLPTGTSLSAELLRYKGELVRDILGFYLGNAKLYREACRSSMVDPLTGLGTRRALEEKLALEYSRGVRYGRLFSVVMVDVDNFKSVNDRHGHAAGDRALRSLAEIFRANTRPTDVTARYGGDEFVVLMPETRLDEAIAPAERLRCRVDEVLSMPDGRNITISCGVAEWTGQPDDTVEDLLHRADFALYEAKRAGRNRVCPATAPASTP